MLTLSPEIKTQKKHPTPLKNRSFFRYDVDNSQAQEMPSNKSDLNKIIIPWSKNSSSSGVKLAFLTMGKKQVGGLNS
jgi:hypothetical protein